MDCHQGIQTREVICIDLNRNNMTIDDNLCNAAARPNEQQSCGSGPYGTRWVREPWSVVSDLYNGTKLFFV